MPTPQMHFIIFALFTFEAQIKTHTGTNVGYASHVIIAALNKWTTVSCSENIVRCKIKIISDLPFNQKKYRVECTDHSSICFIIIHILAFHPGNYFAFDFM